MNALVPSAGASRPVVTLSNGQAVVSSLDVARRFGRPHKTVLASIDLLIERRPDLLGQKFLPDAAAASTGSNGGTRETRTFLMNRDGFSLLVMGFTGERALAWKLDYIEAFNAMEAELRSRAAPAPAALDLNDPGALRGLLLGYTEKVLALEAKVVQTEQRAAAAEFTVAASAPKVEFYDRFAEADGHYGLQNAARAIGAPPNLFIRWLKESYLFYQGSTLMPRAGFVKMGVFEVKVRLETVGGVERACSQTYVTPFGLTFLAKRWERAKLTPKGDRDLFGNAA